MPTTDENNGTDSAITNSSDALEHMWDMYLAPIKTRIRDRARDNAKTNGHKEIEANDAIEALHAFIPGHPVDESKNSWFKSNITGFMLVTGVMTLMFGFFGLAPFLIGIKETNAASFLEIAKIFAGALVGSAAGAAASSITKR